MEREKFSIDWCSAGNGNIFRWLKLIAGRVIVDSKVGKLFEELTMEWHFSQASSQLSIWISRFNATSNCHFYLDGNSKRFTCPAQHLNYNIFSDCWSHFESHHYYCPMLIISNCFYRTLLMMRLSLNYFDCSNFGWDENRLNINLQLFLDVQHNCFRIVSSSLRLLMSSQNAWVAQVCLIEFWVAKLWLVLKIINWRFETSAVKIGEFRTFKQSCFWHLLF